MLIIQNISYKHPNKDLLFGNIDLKINKQDKIALIGNNGMGKSTLLKIMAGILQPSGGSVNTDTQPYYIPQHFGQFNHCTIAQALQIDDKLNALQAILAGEVTETNLALLNDDWGIEERCNEALNQWQLSGLQLSQKMETLSGGQKTKVFLAGINIHQPEIVLMDEPGNHLDLQSRKLLYHFIQNTASTLVVVSHDRKLLNLLNTVCELSKQGISIYGGNYDFYTAQKTIERNALYTDIKSKEKALRKARETERETLERKQKLDARGKQKQEKAGVPKIMMNTLRNNAEKSTSRLKSIHDEKAENITQQLNELRTALPDADKIKLDFNNSALHHGKTLITATNINFTYNSEQLWKQALNISINSGERIAIQGTNGAGKTTLIKLFLGLIKPQSGTVQKVETKAIYIDQDYSLIDNNTSIYEQAQQFNTNALAEHDIKTRLTRFLFTKDYWDKPCAVLSGGEKMRLILCCLTIIHQSPDIIILDEPTNNLDIQNIEILTAAINNYNGTLIVVSHDEYFLDQIHITRTIDLN